MPLNDKRRADESRTTRRARPKTSLKMQAIGFLSRREHSRQELRTKLLAALRKRAREDAQLAAATAGGNTFADADADADAAAAPPSNGIDDAFAPPSPPASRTGRPVVTRSTGGSSADRRRPSGLGDGDGDGTSRDGDEAPAHHSHARRAGAVSAGRSSTSASAGKRDAATGPSSILDRLRLASGDALPARLRANPVLAAPAGLAAIDDAGRRSSHASAADTIVIEDGAESDGEIRDAAHADADALADLDDADLEHDDPESAVDQLLDWLAAHGYLSDARFVESRINARSRKQGTTRIRHELSRHGLALAPEQAASLRETEFARAQAIWQRKFGEVGADARERAKQARFLAARGFAAEVVRRIVGGDEEF